MRTAAPTERVVFTLADVLEYETRACWWLPFTGSGYLRLLTETYLEWKSYRKWLRCHRSRQAEALYRALKETGRI
jgi:hypothetical protein